MSYEIGTFVFGLIDSMLLLFVAVFAIVNLSDLECDYINARTCCKRLNKVIYLEIIGHALLILSVLFTAKLLPILIALPMTLWVLYRALKFSKAGAEMYDPAEILNRNQLKSHLRESLIKLGYHLLSFFVFLYCIVIELQEDQSTEKPSQPLQSGA